MRKLCRMIFSRYFVSAIVILAELTLIFYLLFEAYEYSIYALIVIVGVNVAVVITLINRNANPEYKVSWLVIVMLVPPFGAALYAMFYSRRLSKKEIAFMRKIESNFNSLCDTDAGDREVDRVFFSLKDRDALAAGKAYAILNDDPISSLYSGTSSTYYADGENMYSDMLRDISRAEKFIFLEYFIIGEGVMWDKIHELLVEKVRTGVEVRVIYDDIGCMKTLPSRYDRILRSEGIKCIRFAPVTPRISTSHNNRDHRKILIIDGKISYTGGINIADEYINAKKRFGHWKDGGVRVCGLAVSGFLKLFITSWDLYSGTLTEIEKYFSDVEESDLSDGGYYIPFGSGPAPLYNRPVGKNAILNIINQAERYVYITTPYLVIDYELTESLRCAAIRGVDVRIITPGVADKKLVKVMTKSAYPHLMRAGVKIYEYTPGFIHSKILISDDLYAIIGTINFDYRSLVHHFEDAVWIYNSRTVESVKEDFMNTVANSDERDEREAKLTPLEWTVRNLIKIFAPLL